MIKRLKLPESKNKHFDVFIGALPIASITQHVSFGASYANYTGEDCDADIRYDDSIHLSYYNGKEDQPLSFKNIIEAINYIMGKLPNDIKNHIKIIEITQ
jgi:hypothetical protein